MSHVLTVGDGDGLVLATAELDRDELVTLRDALTAALDGGAS